MGAELRGAEWVREVFTRVRNGDDGVADLFSEDGVVVAGGARIEGRDAIRAFYRKQIDALHPQPEVELVLSDDESNVHVALVDVPTDNGLLHALDLFTIDDEGIQRLEIYPRYEGET